MSAQGVRRGKAALFQWVQIPPGHRSSRVEITAAIASSQNFHKNRTSSVPAMKPSETAQHLG